MAVQDITGRSIAFFVDDFSLEDTSTVAFDPITTLHDADHVSPTEMNVQHAVGLYEKNGFLVRPNADGAVYVVTWRQYQNAITKQMTRADKLVILADLEPKKWNGLAGAWIECPVVKVMGGDGDDTGHYVTAATECEIGIIL